MADEDVAWTDVLSTRVTRVGYDDKDSKLYVEWSRTGRTSVYHDVPPDVADEFTKSWSVGSRVNDLLSSYRMTYE
jgi:KTSC domain